MATPTRTALDQFLDANPEARVEYDRRIAHAAAEAAAEAATEAAARAERAEFVVDQQRAMLDLLMTNKAEYDRQMNAMIKAVREGNAQNEALLTEVEALRSRILCKALSARNILPQSCSTQMRMQYSGGWG